MNSSNLHQSWTLGRCYIALLPVGQGSATYLITPSGHSVVIDCGTDGVWSTEKFHRKLRGSGLPMQRAVSSAGAGYDIAKMIVSHPHLDHYRDLPAFFGDQRALSVLNLRRDREQIREALDELRQRHSRGECGDSEVKKVQLLSEMSDHYSVPAEAREYGAGFSLEVYCVNRNWLSREFLNNSQRRLNNGSLVVVASFGNHKWVVPGDMEIDGWEKLLGDARFVNAARGVTHFVASHHGHDSGWHPEVVRTLGKPRVWLVSTKKGDEHCADAYYRGEHSYGIENDDGVLFHSLSTKRGHVIEWCGSQNVDAIQLSSIDCSRNTNQQRMFNLRQDQALRGLN